jgi:hypothetical protein
MSDDMNIILNPKYSDFINIIDNYENTTKDTPIIKSDSSSKSSKCISLKSSEITKHEKHDKSSKNTNDDNETNKIKDINEHNETNTVNETEIVDKTNKTSSEKPDNISNSDSLSETRKIFNRLHLLISTPPNNKIVVISENNDDIKQNEQNKEDEKSSSESGKFIVKKESPKKESSKKESPKKHKKKRINRENQNEEEQKEKLELMYEREIYKDNFSGSEEKIDIKSKKKTSKDELKKLCRQFEDNCIMESIRDFNVKEDMYYINMDILTKNIMQFNTNVPQNYECCIFYRNYKDPKVTLNPDKKIGWMEISKTGEKFVTSKNKMLSSSLRLFEKTNKFRKTINDIKVRAFKLTFLVYKTNIKIDILALIKLTN